MYTLLSNLKNNVECNRKKCEEDLKLHPVNLLDNLMAGGGQVDIQWVYKKMQRFKDPL